MKNAYQEFSDAMSCILIGWFDVEFAIGKNDRVEGLGNRVSRNLRNAGLEINPEFMSNFDRANIVLLPNIGKKAMKEIDSWCQTHGFPKPVYRCAKQQKHLAWCDTK